jgi:hypothetical protein
MPASLLLNTESQCMILYYFYESSHMSYREDDRGPARERKTVTSPFRVSPSRLSEATRAIVPLLINDHTLHIIQHHHRHVRPQWSPLTTHDRSRPSKGVQDVRRSSSAAEAARP